MATLLRQCHRILAAVARVLLSVRLEEERNSMLLDISDLDRRKRQVRELEI